MNSKFTRALIHIILVLLIILLFMLTRDFLNPVYSILSFLITPFILAIYIFYAFRPIRNRITKWTGRNTLAAVITFLLFIVFSVFLIFITTDLIINQFMSFVQTLDFDRLSLALNSIDLEVVNDYVDVQAYIDKAEQLLQQFAAQVPYRLQGLIGNLANIGSVLLLIIIGFFYLLKDEEEVSQSLAKLPMGPYTSDIRKILHEIHNTLEDYIAGQIFVAVLLGVLMFVGYLIIGLPYSFALALIAMLFNFIPFIGPFLGAVPAVVVALTMSPMMILKVALVSVVVQQLEGNVITPNIMGSKLDIHPFVVMISVLISMSLFGVLGALVATPLYMVIKIVITNLHIIRLRSRNMNPIPDEGPLDFREK
ncbi:MAG: AI-2E family transporter [Tissierellia bacterium]|nr:AI-2E family transporter [Tissierellia bacterium]